MATEILFRGRHAACVENDLLRVTVLKGGGHIAEVLDKRAGLSPLWIPHWTSIEPSSFDSENPGSFGTGSDAKLLAGIMGHNLCLDLFGGPSEEEARAGYSAHGEASVDLYDIVESAGELTLRLTLRMAQLEFTRSVQLHGQHVRIRETTENLTAMDRPLAWTQHVTLSPPFLDPDATEFRASMTRSMVSLSDPGFDSYLKPGAEFAWPMAPRRDGGVHDLRRMHATAPASGYTAHIADPHRDDAYFVSYAPRCKLAFGYIWKRADFPWLGIWEENCSRKGSPWDGRTVTRGMEFGVSPFPESRRAMVERSTLLDTPAFKWLPARGRIEVEYWITSQVADAVPEALVWPAV
jgi:hypothetical protein